MGIANTNVYTPPSNSIISRVIDWITGKISGNYKNYIPHDVAYTNQDYYEKQQVDRIKSKINNAKIDTYMAWGRSI